jgi:hypothetical protein
MNGRLCPFRFNFDDPSCIQDQCLAYKEDTYTSSGMQGFIVEYTGYCTLIRKTVHFRREVEPE